ncbi:kinase-like domain-containing protein [Fomitopsis serialis]|uniref:kinase-like domain-containing protein n=1 Tax=Fomitopsis serialis TaxID=139415 RepID=UPI0020075189|nr:kinase-like domain-containing protein [Neoantrodia serialis]KAH9936263.1 kinase-like domain-containing protein [Neoantrodia serialis]
MLQAVQVIHEEKIVHSDLKPANFVLVKGQLKLIDFGIANAIANDTTNIQRDHQVGTVNYMSPEAIELPEGMRRLKVGRPSDVWSLGCILYQMVYGYPPFHHLDLYQKMRAIPDRDHSIEFPEYSTPVSLRSGSNSPSSQKRMEEMKVKVPRSVIATMKQCLVRNPKERITIPELLEESWLTMCEPNPLPAPTPPPPARPVIAQDEALINPHFMQQLLRYGLHLGRAGTVMEGEQLANECKV